MLMVSGLYIYPIKSLGGIAVTSAAVTSRGLQFDRRLMLIDSNNRSLTQREFPQMALLQPEIKSDGLYIYHKKKPSLNILVPHRPKSNELFTVSIWDDTCSAQFYDTSINAWFSHALEIPCTLAYMPDSCRREVDKNFAQQHELTSFSDAYPMLLIGQSSLDDLNTRLAVPLPMDRFRPNIVFTGGAPYAEDELAAFTISGIAFSGVKPCARCVITTINQEDASGGKEPLKTLAGYRQKKNKILFGQNLLHHGDGTIRIGDQIAVDRYQPAAI